MLVRLVAAKENCFHEPFKTIKTVRISKYDWLKKQVFPVEAKTLPLFPTHRVHGAVKHHVGSDSAIKAFSRVRSRIDDVDSMCVVWLIDMYINRTDYGWHYGVAVTSGAKTGWCGFNDPVLSPQNAYLRFTDGSECRQTSWTGGEFNCGHFVTSHEQWDSQNCSRTAVDWAGSANTANLCLPG